VAAIFWALLRLLKSVNDRPKGEGGSVSRRSVLLEADDLLDVDDRRLDLEADDDRTLSVREDSARFILSSLWRVRWGLLAEDERGRLVVDDRPRQ
jgi:hypothetical protein